jgi:hypothetical protein
LRAWPGIIEPKAGIFYVRRQPCLHFHLVEGGRRRADVKGRAGWVQLDLPRLRLRGEAASIPSRARDPLRRTLTFHPEDIMANDRGLLPKASREQLDEHQRRQLDRWYENAYQDDNLFLTMARRPGLLDATWGFIRYIYGGASSIEPELFELLRVKLAWNNRCVH